MLNTFKRVIKSGWLSFTRDGGIAAATIFILAMAIFLISAIFLSRDVGQFLITSIKEKVDISVYFRESSTEEDILTLKDQASKIPEVKEIQYVSKEMALGEFLKKHKEEQVLMESLAEVGGNPFLASLNIKAWDANQYERIAEFFKNPSLVSLIEKVDYYQRKPLINRVFSLASFFNNTGILLSIVLIILASLVTFNTVRLAILNSSEEIKIQRLVGASNWFIRGPFLVEGTISGILATLICFVIFSISCWFFSPKIEMLLSGLSLFNFFTQKLWIFLLLQLGTGIGLGIISSLIAIRKYLKV